MKLVSTSSFHILDELLYDTSALRRSAVVGGRDLCREQNIGDITELLKTFIAPDFE